MICLIPVCLNNKITVICKGNTLMYLFLHLWQSVFIVLKHMVHSTVAQYPLSVHLPMNVHVSFSKMICSGQIYFLTAECTNALGT